MSVDPNEAPAGFIAVEIPEVDNCSGCYFREMTLSGGSCGQCGAIKDRADGCQVIFVPRTNKPATANFPHDDMGTPV